MNNNKNKSLINILSTILLCCISINALAGSKIAILEFELKDLTLKPRIPAEIKRTASIKPLLEAELKTADYEIINPYVFEFLGIQSKEVMHESDLENALLHKLKDFLFEMGHGFCFEARQKRILIGKSML